MNVKRKRIALYSFVIISAITLFAFKNSGDRYFEIAKNLDIFATLFKEVNAYYVDEINPNRLMRTGIESMLENLDPYTNYIPEDDIEDYRTLSTGQYGGIGVQNSKFGDRYVITMVFEGFSADKGGLKIGDELISIDGRPVKQLDREEVAKLFKGQVNTTVDLKIKRYGINDPIEVKLKREKITIDNVPYFGMVNDNIGYLKLTEFTMNAGRSVSNAINSLKAKGAEKIIFDLRGNPGGLLIEAVNVTNIFIPKGLEVVSTRGKIEENNASYKTLNPAVDTKIPLVILIDRGSASASEIVAGAIQDFDRGVLVGEKSYGKGLVQQTRPLSYNSQLKVTTAKYYIPSGRSIQAIDYSNRRPDGSVGKIPDSLKVAWKTKNGRTVYDGGGVDPDVDAVNFEIPLVAYTLLSKGLIFDYATEYFNQHKQINDPKIFEISDQEYQKFTNWLTNKDYDYTTEVERQIDKLLESAKEEKYYSKISDQIIELKLSVKHNKNTDLQLHKGSIKKLLKAQILSRYYLQKGAIEGSFQDDEVVLTAVNILNDPSRYQKLLGNN